MGWVAFLGLGCCVGVFALSMAMPQSKHRSDAVAVALILAGSWVAYTMLNTSGLPPDNMRLFPLVDLASGLLILTRYMGHRDLYKLRLMQLIGLQLALHPVYWVLHAEAPEIFQGIINTSYNVELFALGMAQFAYGAWPGAADAVRRIRAALSGGLHHRYRVGAG